jgi:hypothetical protein
MARDFEVVGPLENPEVIARGTGVRVRHSLAKRHGKGNWRKLKAIALVRLSNGSVRRAEIHWYEAHGIGRVRWKIKAFVG